MEFTVDPLPYAENALEPHISKRTVGFHYQKHHKGYMRKLDAALAEDDPRRSKDLAHIVMNSEGKIFNCAAQVWNHTFYWNSLDPSGQSTPSAALQQQIAQDFGGIDNLKDQLAAAGAGEFGSGWAWLTWNAQAGKLEVTSTTDAENPIPQHATPLLTIDVWEHAYYLDYQNDRGGYLGRVIENLLNWEFASQNFAKAQ